MAKEVSPHDLPLGELAAKTVDDVKRLIETEVELAKAELREEMTLAATGGGALAAATVTGLLSLLLLAFAAAWGLAELMPTGAAFALVGGATGLVAVALLAAGRQRLRSVTVLPETKATIKETLNGDGEQIDGEEVAWATGPRN